MWHRDVTHRWRYHDIYFRFFDACLQKRTLVSLEYVLVVAAVGFPFSVVIWMRLTERQTGDCTVAPELNWEYCGAVAGLYNSCAVSCGRSCVVGVVELSSYSCSQLQFFWDAVYIATRIKKLPSYCCRESSRELFTEAFVERYCEYLSSNEKKVRKISLKLLWNCFETVLKLFCQLQLPNIGLFLNKKCNSGKWFWYSRYLTANSSNHTLAR